MAECIAEALKKTVCLSLDNGDLIWEKSNDNACSSPCRMIIDGDKLIVGANWDEIIAYNKYNGKRIWANKKDGIRYRTATPVIYEGELYTAATSKIFEIDKEDGKILRSRDTGINLDTATAPYIVDGI